MSIPRNSSVTVTVAFVASLLFAQVLKAAPAATGIFINGVELSQQQMAMLYQTTGVVLPPGHYLVQGGCVSHLESGQTQCAPQPGQYADGGYDDGGTYGFGAYGYSGGYGGGYGYDNGDGTWFHRGSDYSGGYSVGSDSNGCIYTPNWSNC